MSSLQSKKHAALSAALSLTLIAATTPAAALAQTANAETSEPAAIEQPAGNETNPTAAEDPQAEPAPSSQESQEAESAAETPKKTVSSRTAASDPAEVDQAPAAESAKSTAKSNSAAAWKKRASASIKKATYYLKSAVSATRTIAVRKTSLAQKANVQISKATGALDQKWKITSVGDGFYRIQNAKSKRALSAVEKSSVPGSNVVQATWKNQKSQKWKIIPEGDGRYAIVSALDDTSCLETASSSAGIESNVRLARYKKAKRQLFRLKRSSGSITKNQLLDSLDSVSKKSSVKTFGGGTFNAKSKAGKRLNKAIKAVRKHNKALSMVMMDLNTGAGISVSPKRIIYGASTVKGPYVAGICKYYPNSARRVKKIIRPTIKRSSNEDYSRLRNRFGSGPERKMMDYADVSSFSPVADYVFIASRDLGKMWVGNYWYFFKDTNKNSEWCRKLYRGTYYSFISWALGDDYAVYSKPGWGYFSGLYGHVHDDAAIVMDKGHPYLLVIESKALGQSGKLKELARAADAVHAEMVK